MTFDIDKLEAQLIKHEGLRLKPYVDTVGKLTIGIGHNLTDVGISREQAMSMLLEDIESVEAWLDVNLVWWQSLSEVRQRALMDLVFNLGGPKLLTFHDTLDCLKTGKYAESAKHLLDSTYAKQVGKRANDIAYMIQFDKDPV